MYMKIINTQKSGEKIKYRALSGTVFTNIIALQVGGDGCGCICAGKIGMVIFLTQRRATNGSKIL